MNFYERIHALCVNKSMSITALCREIGIGTSNGTYWKNGSIPNGENLIQLSEFFDVSIDFLLTGKQISAKDTIDKNVRYLMDNFGLLDYKGKTLVQVTAVRELGRVDGTGYTPPEYRQEYSDNEILLLAYFRRLTDEGKDFTKHLLESYLIKAKEDSSLTKVAPAAPHEKPLHIEEIRSLAVYSQSVSAGTGTFLDSDDYEVIDFPLADVPTQTSFAVRITGDSMEPKYEEGEILFVKQQPTLEHGEFGIFMLNGDAFFKKLNRKAKTISLISINPDYPPISVTKTDDFKSIGKVLGSYKN